jgi:hypothetical protein
MYTDDNQLRDKNWREMEVLAQDRRVEEFLSMSSIYLFNSINLILCLRRSAHMGTFFIH